MPPPPPHLIDELVEECFLHLPPDDPAGLVRVALVCKRWRRILEDRGFHRRFRERHGRTPRMLGFFQVDKRIGACFFTPTSSFHPRNADGFRGRRAIDSRHGRVLLARPPSLRNLTVWDPITGEQVDLPGLLPQYPCQFGILNSRAAVLCADSGGACDHVDCHRGHFVVVLLHAFRHKVYAHVYSSQAGTWSKTSSAAQDLDGPRCFFHSDADACALAGNTLYFSVYTKMKIGILKYDLGAQEIGFVDLPPDCADKRRQILLTTTREDGGLGIAKIENTRLRLWSSDGALGWAPSGVIELETLLPVRRPMVTGCIYMVTFVHGLGAFLVRVHAGAFTVDIVSGRVRKVADNRRARYFVPYTSFCVPGLRNQVHGVSNK